MSEKPELQYYDPAARVRRLRDYVSRELAGLNEDNPIEALLYAEYRLANELQMIRLVLGVAGEEYPKTVYVDNGVRVSYGHYFRYLPGENDDDDTDET